MSSDTSTDTNTSWPVIAGSYQVGDPQAPVAICALTSESLIAPLAHLPGVAITGKLYTANLGISRIVVNITANPAIRSLLICGKDSPLFRPGQSLVALAENGMDDQRQIIGATGYEPVLQTLTPEHVLRFRRQVEVIDWAGEEDVSNLERRIGELAARNPGQFTSADGSARLSEMATTEERFAAIRPGGVREPLQYDPKGYFVITLDREHEQIILRHYLPGHSPAHEMRGRMAGSMMLGLLREGLVSQLSHAGYLGAELAKAEAALSLNLRYDQDRPLRSLAPTPPAAPAPETPSPSSAARPAMSQIQPPLTWKQLEASALDSIVNVTLSITDLADADLLEGTFLEPDEADPFSGYRRTQQRLRVRWTSATIFAMGESSDLTVDAVVRVLGTFGAGNLVGAQRIVILTRVARILE
jgi:tetrahydromethanopterin S-methyltransferase subunit A